MVGRKGEGGNMEGNKQKKASRHSNYITVQIEGELGRAKG